MKKLLTSTLILLLSFGLMGCSSDAVKTVEAFGISCEVPKDWDDFWESSISDYEVFGQEARAEDITNGSLEIVAMSTIDPSNMTFAEAREIVESDPDSSVSMLSVNNTEVLKAVYVDDETRIFAFVPSVNHMAEKLIMFTLPESDYQADPDFYDSIMNTLVF